ncbi:MAG: nucleotide pyrophosphohydrolase [Patescibacteria group bacterium]
MDFKEIIKRAKEIQKAYRLFNQKNGQAEWDVSAYTQGFVGDVGDLMKLIMAKNNLRQGDDLDKKLSHELSDCLWSIIVIAIELDIDLEKEFLKSMDDLETKVRIK